MTATVRVQDEIAALVSDGTTKRILSSKGNAILMPESDYEALMLDAYAWRQMQERGVIANMPDVEKLTAAAFG